MKRNLLNVSNFFNLSNVWCKDLFDKKNIIEAFTNVGNYILKVLQKKPKGFKHYKREVFIDKGTIIRHGVVFEGKCIIGKNCVIGPNSFFRGNVIIGDNTKVGNACEIKNSIILNNSSISHLSYIGDSVIGSNVNIGAGTVCSNFRLDEKEIFIKLKNKVYKTGLKKFGSIIGDNSKIGANTVLNPGTVLSKNCIVWPLVAVSGYYSDNQIIK